MEVEKRSRASPLPAAHEPLEEHVLKVTPVIEDGEDEDLGFGHPVDDAVGPDQERPPARVTHDGPCR